MASTLKPDATSSSRRIAFFVRGIDGLFMPKDLNGIVLCALVEVNSLQEQWFRTVASEDCILSFRLRTKKMGPYPSTEALLRHSNIHALLKSHRISALMLSSSCTPFIHQWAIRHKIRLIGPGFQHQQQFENKIWFDRFLIRHRIPKPQSCVRGLKSMSRLPLPFPIVLQKAESMGGEGTFIVRTPRDLDALHKNRRLLKHERLLIREFIDGDPYGITLFISKQAVAMSAIRLQCYYSAENGYSSRVFAGVQWTPTSQLTASLKKELNVVFSRFGAILQHRGFFGFANVDFMIDRRGNVLLLECNPRMSAATPQLFQFPTLMADIPAAQIYLHQFQTSASRRHAINQLTLPTTTFEGSTFDITFVPGSNRTHAVIRREFPCGRYKNRGKRVEYCGAETRHMRADNEFALIAFGQIGQTLSEETTLATVISNGRLYNARGNLLPRAKILVSHFDFIDDHSQL